MNSDYLIDRRTALKRSALLMGAGLAGAVFAGMTQGCQVNAGSDWTPSFFTTDEAAWIGAYADHLLPRTETPGARDVFVDRFLDHLVAAGFATEARQGFRQGLNELDQACRDLNGKSLDACSDEEKDRFFASQEAEPMQPTRSLWGNTIVPGGTPSFYRQLKGLCLFGYFSSETVGKEVLSYDPVPGKFVGCLPLVAVGNAWTEG